MIELLSIQLAHRKINLSLKFKILREMISGAEEKRSKLWIFTLSFSLYSFQNNEIVALTK